MEERGYVIRDSEILSLLYTCFSAIPVSVALYHTLSSLPFPLFALFSFYSTSIRPSILSYIYPPNPNAYTHLRPKSTPLFLLPLPEIGNNDKNKKKNG